VLTPPIYVNWQSPESDALKERYIEESKLITRWLSNETGVIFAPRNTRNFLPQDIGEKIAAMALREIFGSSAFSV
jgi:hypothetical protein